MKYTNRQAFQKHLEGAFPAHFADVYLIIMKDSVERKECVDLLTHFLLKGKAYSDFCLTTFDSDRLSAETLDAELQALSFLSDKRVLLLNQGEKMAKPLQGCLEEYFTRTNRSICLIISAPSISAVSNFYKKAEKCGVILDVAEEKAWEKEKSQKEWVISAAAKVGKKIEGQTATCFLKHVGAEPAIVHNEFEKLLTYVGERHEIVPTDIGAVCTKINLENGWQLGEAIFRRDPKGALKVARALLGEGVPFLTLLRQVRSQFQTEFQICSLLATGGSAQDVTQQFPYMKGIILERHIQNAQNYGMHRFKAGLLKIDEVELKFKSSALSIDILMELLMIKLAAQ